MKDQTKGVVIGCFGGFWGDSMDHAVAQFLRSREAESIDYLVSDYLAEVTMCILAKKKARPSPGMGEGGFVEDFVTRIWKPMGQLILEKNIKVIVNAGGMNPLGLKRFIEAESKAFPVKPIVAAVIGDDLLDTADKVPLSEFAVDGVKEPNDSGIAKAIAEKRKLSSMNAYLGAQGITRALAVGANVIVTGRVVDSAMILAPLCHEFNWNYNSDFDRLAAGTIAGHIVECGAQCTGGNFTDWELSLQRGVSANKLFANIGFPLVEVQSSGEFVVTKPTGTGGIVSCLSVAEQLVYEIGDPSQYIVPDVVCDLRALTLEQVDKNRVRVRGVRGQPPTGLLKVTATYSDGFIGIVSFVVAGHNAAAKAKAIAGSVLSRTEKMLVKIGAPEFRATRLELLGANSSYFPTHMDQEETAVEVVARLSVGHASPKAIMLLLSNFASAGTGMCPSVWTLAPGKPALQEAVALRTGLVPAANVATTVVFGPEGNTVTLAKAIPSRGDIHPQEVNFPAVPRPSTAKAVLDSDTVLAPLICLACCRSGDKGDSANVGVIARDPQYYAFLEAELSVDRVSRFLERWFTEKTTVKRYLIPGFQAFNFVLSHVLGGGGLVSLKGDKQGKSIASILLCMKLNMPKRWSDAYYQGIGAQKQRIRSRL